MKYETIYSKPQLDFIEENISIIGLYEAYLLCEKENIKIGSKRDKDFKNNPYVIIRNAINKQFRINTCPFHRSSYDIQDFYINDEKHFYYCHGCGNSGNCYDLLIKLYDISFDSAANILSALLGNKLKRFTKKEKNIYNKLSKNYYKYIDRFVDSNINTIKYYSRIENDINTYLNNGFFLEHGIEYALRKIADKSKSNYEDVLKIYQTIIETTNWYNEALTKYDEDCIKYFFENMYNGSYAHFLSNEQARIKYIKSRKLTLHEEDSNDDLPF